MTYLPAYVDQAFAFAHGRIGVLQLLLLSSSDVDRLLGSHDTREAEKILTELKLTTQINQSLSHEEEILDAVALWVKDEVTRMVPKSKKDVFSILWLVGDAPLLSYLLKKKRKLTSAISREPTSVVTAHDPAALRSLVETERDDHLPTKLVSFVKETLKKESLTPMDIDTRVAQFIADEQGALTKKSGSAGLRQFVQHGIDTLNIRTALRLLDATPEERTRHLIRGGRIPTETFAGTRAQIAYAIEEKGLGYDLADLIHDPDADGTALERALSDVLAEDISLLWNVPLSVEPLFAFAALTLSQLRLLRVLLIGKRSHLSPQEIKKMLPPFIPATHYVL